MIALEVAGLALRKTFGILLAAVTAAALYS